MDKNFLNYQFAKHPSPIITNNELAFILDGTADSRYSKIKRLIAKNKLLHIRRGLYCLTAAMGYLEKPHPFSLAQFIYAPSYISLESALSYYELIPEAVYAITSVTAKRSNTFNTPFGEFTYHHLPEANFYTEVQIIKDDNYLFFVAKPWKAICDYIFCYKKNWHSLEPLENSLRINIEDLPSISIEEFELLGEYYHNSSVNRFLKAIKNECVK